MPPNRDVSSLLERLPALCALSRECADEAERLHHLPVRLSDALKQSGIFHLLVPVELGGLGGTPRQLFDIGVQLAEADGSTAWVAVQGAFITLIVGACQPSEAARAFYRDPGANLALTIAGQATAEWEGDDLRVKGRWSFVSGSMGATHLGGIVMVPSEDGKPAGMQVWAPRERVTVIPNWETLGMLGTGSHDIVMDNVLIPPESRAPLGTRAEGTPVPDRPGVWAPATSAAAVQLGMARRSLDEVINAVREKPRTFVDPQPVLTHPGVLRDLERCEAKLEACLAGIRGALYELGQFGNNGNALPDLVRVRARSQAANAVWEGADIIRTAYTISGTTGMWKSSPLQRLLRDALCMTQHVSVNQLAVETLARVRLGLEPMSLWV